MSKKFIVKTPFGIGVATSEEDLKELLDLVAGEPASNERIAEMLFGEDKMTQEQTEICDCESCKANIKRLKDLKANVATITDGYILDVMEQDIHEQMQRATPNTRVHLREAFRIIRERNSALTQSVADGIGEAASQEDAFPEELSKQMDAVAKKLLREKGPRLSFGQYVNRFINELSDEMNATGEDAGDERSESQQGSPIEDILSMIFGEPVESSEQAPAPEKITLEKIVAISSLSDLAQVRDDLSRESYELMNEMARMTDRSEEVAELIEAADARKAVITAGNAGEARAMVREQFTALETALNDASMKTGIPDEVFKEVARLKEKFSL